MFNIIFNPTKVRLLHLPTAKLGDLAINWDKYTSVFAKTFSFTGHGSCRKTLFAGPANFCQTYSKSIITLKGIWYSNN